MTIIEEEEIIRQLNDKCTQSMAFEKVVKAYSEKLYWQIRRMVISHEDTNDILQNVFIKVWCSINSFRGESRLYTWLYRIAVNETLTFLNKQRQIQTFDIDSPEGTLVKQLESDEWFDGNKAQKTLQEAILTLPDKQRLVFNLKYFEEMKYEDMSAILGTSVGALKASYHLAVKKISDILKKTN